jgi:hypothetical protein
LGLSEAFLLDDENKMVHVDYITDLQDPESQNVKNLDLSADRVSIHLDSGRIGAGPPDILPDDEVVLFFGAKTPFILRKGPFDDGTYRLIGDCYVHDAMMGEALQDKSAGDSYLDWNSDFFVLT